MKSKYKWILLFAVALVCFIGAVAWFIAGNEAEAEGPLLARKRVFAEFADMRLPAVDPSLEEALLLVDKAQLKPPPPHIYIALGDSVSSGYGLTGYPQNPRGVHSALFFEGLRSGDYGVETHINLAQTALTTTTLLAMLEEVDEAGLADFRNARVITLNIGGNNVLVPFLEYMTALQVVSGAGNIGSGAGGVLSGAWGVLYELATGVGQAVTAPGEAGFPTGGVTSGLGDILSGFGGLIIGAGEIIAGTPDAISTWRGALSPELEELLEHGMQTFLVEFGEILTWLETHAPRATILVNTVYNPIPPEVLLVSVPISNWANVLLGTMNATIREESAARGHLVVDVYARFTNQLGLMQFDLNPFGGAFSLDLIHPSEEGHALIAELHYAAFRQHVRAGITR